MGFRRGKSAVSQLRGEDGQALIIVALSLTCILGFVALGTDVGILIHTKRMMQTVADSAAIAGAAELKYEPSAVAALATNAASDDYGFVNNSNGAHLAVNNPPLFGPHKNDGEYVEVIATQSDPTFFMRAFHITSLNVSARAVATLGSGNGCIYTLNPTGTGLLMNGSGRLNVPNCGIIIDSKDPRSAILVNGSGTITAGSIGVVGGYLPNGPVEVTPTPITGIAPVGDPLAYLSPPAYTRGSCLPNPNINDSGNYTLNPSSLSIVCYNGITINGNANVQLNPGVYVINGAFIDNGSSTVQGTGVTFYLPRGATFIDNGSSTLKVSAPTSGDYNGLLFYQDPANRTPVTINGSGSSVFTGIFYFPSAQLTLNGSNSTTFNAAFVSGSFLMNGSGRFTNYALLNGSGPLTSARLVE